MSGPPRHHDGTEASLNVVLPVFTSCVLTLSWGRQGVGTKTSRRFSSAAHCVEEGGHNCVTDLTSVMHCPGHWHQRDSTGGRLHMGNAKDVMLSECHKDRPSWKGKWECQHKQDLHTMRSAGIDGVEVAGFAGLGYGQGQGWFWREKKLTLRKHFGLGCARKLVLACASGTWEQVPCFACKGGAMHMD